MILLKISLRTLKNELSNYRAFRRSRRLKENSKKDKPLYQRIKKKIQDLSENQELENHYAMY